MQVLETHQAPIQKNPIRIQEYGVSIFYTLSTRSAIKKAIKKGLILIDGKTATTAQFIEGGEEISLLGEDAIHKPFHLDLTVLFEDDYLAIIDKPAGISVSGNSFATIDNALSQNLQISSQVDSVKPRPVHRLDYPTSGLLLIGKTSSAIQKLNELFVDKTIQKTYVAITIGQMDLEGKINTPIDGKEAFSFFTVLSSVKSEKFNYLNLVRLHPKTGRKHQLRKHLSSIGNPILGDQQYGKEGQILKGKGLYLHASELAFIHPLTQEKINIRSELPKKFYKIFP